MKYTRKKKLCALLLFVVFSAMLLLGGMGLYYVNHMSDFLFSKAELLKTPKFKDSETLERMMISDTDTIFEYAFLSRTFSKYDEVNRNVPLYEVYINGSWHEVSLKDLELIQRILEGQAEWTQEEYQAYLARYAVKKMSAGAVNPRFVEDTWGRLDNAEKERLICQEGIEKKFNEEDRFPERVTILQDDEILIYPGQRCLVRYDYAQQTEVNEELSLLTLYTQASAVLDRYYVCRDSLSPDATNLRFIVRETGEHVFGVAYEIQDGGSASAETEADTDPARPDAETVPSEEKANTALSEAEAYALENPGALYAASDEHITRAQILALGKYIDYDYSTHEMKSSFTKVEVREWGLAQAAASIVGVDSGASFTIGLDTNYPVSDRYLQAAGDFARCRKILVLSLPAIILGLIGCIISFLYLLACVGHREGYDGIWLDKFDQWPTEIAAFLIVAGVLASIWAFGLLTGFLARMFFTSKVIWTIMQGVSAAFAMLIGMVGFFSLIRRLKAGVLWKNSLLRKVCGPIGRNFRELIQNWPVGVKAAAVVLLYWGISFALAMIMKKDYSSGKMGMFALFFILFIAVQLFAAGVVIRSVVQRRRIVDGVRRIADGELDYEIEEEGLMRQDKDLVDGINHIGAGFQDAVDAAVRSERMKADLITNVSHDIKTPLTSIINYVDLMKRENIENSTVRRYLEVLEQKSQRLKNLTEDLVEASRASSGNLELHPERINITELVRQACGEFEEQFESRRLKPVLQLPENSLYVIADGRRVWRIMENLFQNAKKYAMPGTRVYIVLEEDKPTGGVRFVMKNISESPLNISSEELTERFTRGDTSRTTEGSGLGLSIAKNLTQLQGGAFEIYLNGDLFQVTVEFDLAPENWTPEEDVNRENDLTGYLYDERYEEFFEDPDYDETEYAQPSHPDWSEPETPAYEDWTEPEESVDRAEPGEHGSGNA